MTYASPRAQKSYDYRTNIAALGIGITVLFSVLIPNHQTTPNMENETPETDDFEDGCINPSAFADFARNLERERNSARRMWSIHQDKLAALTEQVRLTIMENLHLADGDVCTLKRLKDAIGFDLDSPENADGDGRREKSPNSPPTSSPFHPPSCVCGCPKYL